LNRRKKARSSNAKHTLLLCHSKKGQKNRDWLQQLQQIEVSVIYHSASQEKASACFIYRWAITNAKREKRSNNMVLLRVHYTKKSAIYESTIQMKTHWLRQNGCYFINSMMIFLFSMRN
jgi:hypothetical protein